MPPKSNPIAQIAESLDKNFAGEGQTGEKVIKPGKAVLLSWEKRRLENEAAVFWSVYFKDAPKKAKDDKKGDKKEAKQGITARPTSKIKKVLGVFKEGDKKEAKQGITARATSKVKKARIDTKRVTAEALIFWNVYFKLKDKRAKDTKGKTKITPAKKAIAKTKKEKEGKKGDEQGFFGRLVENFLTGITAGLSAAITTLIGGWLMRTLVPRLGAALMFALRGAGVVGLLITIAALAKKGWDMWSTHKDETNKWAKRGRERQAWQDEQARLRKQADDKEGMEETDPHRYEQRREADRLVQESGDINEAIRKHTESNWDIWKELGGTTEVRDRGVMDKLLSPEMAESWSRRHGSDLSEGLYVEEGGAVPYKVGAAEVHERRRMQFRESDLVREELALATEESHQKRMRTPEYAKEYAPGGELEHIISDNAERTKLWQKMLDAIEAGNEKDEEFYKEELKNEKEARTGERSMEDQIAQKIEEAKTSTGVFAKENQPGILELGRAAFDYSQDFWRNYEENAARIMKKYGGVRRQAGLAEERGQKPQSEMLPTEGFYKYGTDEWMSPELDAEGKPTKKRPQIKYADFVQRPGMPPVSFSSTDDILGFNQGGPVANLFKSMKSRQVMADPTSGPVANLFKSMKSRQALADPTSGLFQVKFSKTTSPGDFGKFQLSEIKLSNFYLQQLVELTVKMLQKDPAGGSGPVHIPPRPIPRDNEGIQGDMSGPSFTDSRSDFYGSAYSIHTPGVMT